jgi:UMF1 family MFS transporter
MAAATAAVTVVVAVQDTCTEGLSMLAMISREALKPGVHKREVFGWAMYDFANSGYSTVVITAVFAAYFVGGVAEGADWAALAWTSGLSVSYLIVMLTMPGLGAWADRVAGKKRLLIWVTAACVLSTAALALVGPGQVALGLFILVLSNTFFSYGESLTASFLPELAQPEAMGRVSGWGWSLGYLGGMLTLGICLAYVLSAQAKGQTGSQFVPVTMLITALIYGTAALVTFSLLKEHSPAQPNMPVRTVLQSLRGLRQSLREASPYPDFIRLLACAVAYQGGVAVAITLAAIYAEQVIGFQPQETMVLIFVLNLAAFAGAFLLGHLQDRVGHKLTLSLTLLGWVATCIIAALSTNKDMFWWAAAIAGFCMGSSQSSGRAMAALMVPPQRLGEFFGLWTFAIRLASILGPLTYGLITWLSDGNQRLAIGSTSLLFILGLVLLIRVDAERGRLTAQASP